jgi:hypothetical protein
MNVRPVRSINAIFIGVAAMSIGCNSDKERDSGVACDAPLAEAGENISVVLGDTVQLDASGSTICEQNEDSASFTWVFEAVEPGSAIDDSALSENETPEAVASVFVPDLAGTYTLSVVVTDSLNTSSPDFVVVTVASDNQVPVADCGANVNGTVGESVTLDGSASYDPEGDEITYSWGMTDTPACSELSTADLLNADGSGPSMVPDCDGIYTVSLVVGDAQQWSEPDICYIDVVSGNQAPVADAGEGGDLGSCADNPLALNAWGSYDLDADELSYQWSVVEVPAKSVTDDSGFDDPTTPEPRFTWDVTGTYTFQLQVSDGQSWSAPDVVSFTIRELSENDSPVANSGDDQTVNVDADCESSSYIWSCEDCSAVSIDLDGTASFDPNGDELSFYWTESTSSVSFGSRVSALTEAMIPSQAAEYELANTMSFEFNLEVADCDKNANDTVVVSYSCTGESN